MTRCVFCTARIWPWQRGGWLVGLGSWHTRCFHAVRRLGWSINRERARGGLTNEQIQSLLDQAQQ